MKYLKVEFKIVFERDVVFRKNPTIILRSVLGNELRKLTCVLRHAGSCETCALARTCVYSWFFESNIPKTTKYSAGRNKGTHPFVPYVKRVTGATKDVVYQVTLLGKSIDYLPYIFMALKRAGEKGIFKEREKFMVADITVNGNTIISGDGKRVETEAYLKKCIIPDKKLLINKNFKIIKINFITPFRFKKNGKYQDDFSYESMILASLRRLRILFELYGNEDSILPKIIIRDKKNVLDSRIRWKEYSYYSRRQNTMMKLGGIIGYVVLEGMFSEYEIFLLKSAENFNIGKNISFGLGKVAVTEEELT